MIDSYTERPQQCEKDDPGLKLADDISSLVLRKFDELTSQMTSEYSQRKVLAGVVMTTPTGSKVVCVSTGTKCISGEYLSNSGITVNDCHAEVIARRCLCRFLYLQIQQFKVGADESVFIPSESGSGFALKTGVKFHLYISSAPCGDARTSTEHQAASKQSAGAADEHPMLITGQLRAKVHTHEGTTSVQWIDASSQTWEGIMLTMSCSDKLARMNVLGVQGQCLFLFFLHSASGVARGKERPVPGGEMGVLMEKNEGDNGKLGLTTAKVGMIRAASGISRLSEVAELQSRALITHAMPLHSAHCTQRVAV